jgi:hypothetical protein
LTNILVRALLAEWAFGAGKVYGSGEYFEKSFEILQIFVLIPPCFS